MAQRKDDQTNWKLNPDPHSADGCRWELIMPMLLANKAEDKEAAKESSLVPGCWNGVKNIATGTDADGVEWIAWTNCGVSIFGAFEDQKIARKTICPNCKEEAANLKQSTSLNQRCCKHCRVDHQRALAREAAKRRRRAKGEVTTPAVKNCEVCGKQFEPKRSTARFCSSNCRVASHRQKALKEAAGITSNKG